LEIDNLLNCTNSTNYYFIKNFDYKDTMLKFDLSNFSNKFDYLNKFKLYLTGYYYMEINK